MEVIKKSTCWPRLIVPISHPFNTDEVRHLVAPININIYERRSRYWTDVRRACCHIAVLVGNSKSLGHLWVLSKTFVISSIFLLKNTIRLRSDCCLAALLSCLLLTDRNYQRNFPCWEPAIVHKLAILTSVQPVIYPYSTKYTRKPQGHVCAHTCTTVVLVLCWLCSYKPAIWSYPWYWNPEKASNESKLVSIHVQSLCHLMCCKITCACTSLRIHVWSSTSFHPSVKTWVTTWNGVSIQATYKRMAAPHLLLLPYY